MNFTYSDACSAKLAIELQLQEINDILEILERVQKDSGEVESFKALQAELELQLRDRTSQVLAMGLLNSDEEKQAVGDHRLARELAGLRSSDDKLDCQDEQWKLAREIYSMEMDAQSDEVKGQGEDSIVMPGMHRKCNACLEEKLATDTITLHCKPVEHVYCRVCLVGLFTSAVTDTTLFPPRCCKVAIPLEMCRALLTKELIKDFDLRVEEFATPNPTYCSDPDCAKFIQTKDIKHDVAKCVFCNKETCATCKGEKHEGLCPADPHVRLLMDLGERSKWQQCSNCKNLVELGTGCYHMTCRCTHQFCYLCGAQWRTCNCPLFTEEGLLGRREGEEEPQPQREPPRPRPCQHAYIYRVRGPDCDECGARLEFVMECSRCNHLSCWRCINNRA